MESATHPRILLVDDSPGDIKLFQEAVREAGLKFDILTARDGLEALNVLHRERQAAEPRLPDLVILDLNMPKLAGQEILARIKEDSLLKWIPVIVFSNSSAPTDVAVAYQFHANVYVRKPSGLDELVDTLRKLSDFWFGTAVLPKKV
jgi:CheY-like chemotaxis protein